MTESSKLLADYVANGSEPAFRDLVARYVNLGYSTALRLVKGDVYLAQDVTQTVFVRLARRAGKLSDGLMLGGWLHRDTCYVASKTMRAERRRRAREREAVLMNSLKDDSEDRWEKLAPILDDAINRLGNQDRAAILLRFFEQRNFRSVGEALGSNEDAARMRINRALEKLHSLLQRRGVVLPAAALGAALAGAAVTAAPAEFVLTISTAALASAATGAGTAFTLIKLMSMTKLQAGIIGAIVVATATPLVIQHQAQAKLQNQVRALQEQVDELARLKMENERLSNLLAQAQSAQTLAEDEKAQLLRLRAEVGRLRQETNNVAKLREENRQLRTAQAARQIVPPNRQPTPTQPDEPQSVPKESWAFAGYASPEATVQSLLWALRQGDDQAFQAYLNGLTPELRDKIEKDAASRGPNAFAGLGADETGDMTGFRILETIPVSGDETLVRLQSDGAGGDGPVQNFMLKQIEGQWKIAGQPSKPAAK